MSDMAELNKNKAIPINIRHGIIQIINSSPDDNRRFVVGNSFRN